MLIASNPVGCTSTKTQSRKPKLFIANDFGFFVRRFRRETRADLEFLFR